jgi:hypothetical protein
MLPSASRCRCDQRPIMVRRCGGSSDKPERTCSSALGSPPPSRRRPLLMKKADSLAVSWFQLQITLRKLGRMYLASHMAAVCAMSSPLRRVIRRGDHCLVASHFSTSFCGNPPIVSAMSFRKRAFLAYVRTTGTFSASVSAFPTVLVDENTAMSFLDADLTPLPAESRRRALRLLGVQRPGAVFMFPTTFST